MSWNAVEASTNADQTIIKHTDFREMASMVLVLYPTEIKGPTLWVLGVKS